jgi:hypothetical protein
VGLLYPYQKSGILAGNRIRQRWRIHVPTSSAHSTYYYHNIHDDDNADEKSVVDAGKRIVTGYNVSMSAPGKLSVGDYTITVENSSGRFYPGTADSFWSFTHVSYPDYYADPLECLLGHSVWVWYDGEWRSIYSAEYLGRVTDVIFADGGTHDGAQAGTVTITSENQIVSDLLRYEWVEEDGDDADTGFNIYQET